MFLPFFYHHPMQTLYDGSSYQERFLSDIKEAKETITICSEMGSGRNLDLICEALAQTKATGDVWTTAPLSKRKGITFHKVDVVVHHFCVIDRSLVWYSAVGFLGDGTIKDGVIRTIDPSLGEALVQDVEESTSQERIHAVSKTVLDEFSKNRWCLSIEAESTWGNDGTSKDYTMATSVTIEVKDEKQFTTAIRKSRCFDAPEQVETIREIVESELQNIVERDFDHYVTAEEYYEPVIEDYQGNLNDILSKFCVSYGLSLIDADYDSTESDYYYN